MDKHDHKLKILYKCVKANTNTNTVIVIVQCHMAAYAAHTTN